MSTHVLLGGFATRGSPIMKHFGKYNVPLVV